MIFLTGPLFSGKRTFAGTLEGTVLADAQELARNIASEDLEPLAERLSREYDIIIASEVGAGIVPVERAEREFRENAGHLSCLLAERADTVVRLCCGIPEVLKGELS